jgi:hypothetical protein
MTSIVVAKFIINTNTKQQLESRYIHPRKRYRVLNPEIALNYVSRDCHR